MPCKFRPNPHTKIRMIERGISDKEAIDVITKGSRNRLNGKIKAKYGMYEAIYRKAPCNYYVETIYLK